MEFLAQLAHQIVTEFSRSLKTQDGNLYATLTNTQNLMQISFIFIETGHFEDHSSKEWEERGDDFVRDCCRYALAVVSSHFYPNNFEFIQKKIPFWNPPNVYTKKIKTKIRNCLLVNTTLAYYLQVVW